MNHLIVISAPSGAGKTTLCQRLLAEFPELVLSISSTTRAPRGQEKDGVEYHFMKVDEFEDHIAKGHFAEWAKVHENYYGTSKLTIEAAFNAGKSVLLDIDVQGAESLRKAYPKEAFTVFVAPPSLEILEARLRSRGTDKEETIRKRVRNAEAEMFEAPKFHKTIVNDQLDRASSELSQIIGARLRGTRHA